MSYLILDGCSMGDLESEVRLYMENGWKLQGGVSVLLNSNGTWQFFQAVIKDKS